VTATARQEFREVRDEINALYSRHRDFLLEEPRIRRPLEEARDAAKVKYEDARSGEPEDCDDCDRSEVCRMMTQGSRPCDLV